LPQGRVSAGSQPQLPHSQSALQVWLRAFAQSWVAPGAQLFSPPQSDQVMMPLAGSHELVCVPQLPQLRELAGGQV
jgi:hypothetical protein